MKYNSVSRRGGLGNWSADSLVRLFLVENLFGAGEAVRAPILFRAVLFRRSWLAIVCAGLGLLLCRPAPAAQVYEDHTFITLAGPAEAGPGSRDGTNRFARFNYP